MAKAARKIEYRDVAPVIQRFRDFLLGRKHTVNLRFEPQMASRSPPLPALPEGPAHRLNDNYYCKRDARREVRPPTLLAGSEQAQIAASGEAGTGKLRRPGTVYQWD